MLWCSLFQLFLAALIAQQIMKEDFEQFFIFVEDPFIVGARGVCSVILHLLL
jgi:hypothetical protein